MAVLIEFLSVIVRRDAIVRSFAGGWDAFLENVPNLTLCADDYLARVGFMIPVDAKAFMAQLENLGLVYRESGKAADFVLVDQMQGPTIDVEWLNLGEVEIQGGKIQIGSFYLEKLDGRVALPTDPNWAPEDSLKELPEERVQFLRHDSEKQVDVFLDPQTGKEKYVGRPTIKGNELESASIAVDIICKEAFEIEGALVSHIAREETEKGRVLIERLSEQLLPAAVALAEGAGKNLAQAHFTVGCILRILRCFAEAEAYFRRANELKKHDIQILLGLVCCLGEQQRAAEALPFAREAVNVAPRDAWAWGNLVLCHIRCGDRNKARKALDQALLVDPRDQFNRDLDDNFEKYFQSSQS